MFNKNKIKSLESQILELNRLLKRERARSGYWEYRFTNLNEEPLVIGSKEDIEYVKSARI